MARRFDVVAYLKLFRFPLVFTAIADSATGHWLVAREHGVHWCTLPLLALASGGLYFFGMSLNDLADRHRDKDIAPGRMLPSGRLNLRSAWTACLSALGVSLIAVNFIRESPLQQRLAVWFSVVFFICAYNLFLKVPPVMGLVRAGNLLLGLLSTLAWSSAQDQWHDVVALVIPTFTYVTALTYVSTLEDGTPNRRKLAIGAVLMVVGAGLASFIVPVADLIRYNPPNVSQFFHRLPEYWRPIPFIAVLSAVIIFRAWKAMDKKGVMLLVRDGVGGIIFLDAALLASTVEYTQYWKCFAVAALALPAALSIAIFKKLA